MDEKRKDRHDNVNEPAGERPAHATRCGFIALVGAPNAGKSTLVNQLVGAKVAIVTHKVQTTRSPLRGIAIRGASQLVFVDTPGIFAPRRRLERAMVEAAWRGAEGADIVAFIVDAAKASHRKGGLDADTARILERLAELRKPRLLILNKIDRMAKEALLALAAELTAACPFERTFMISALKGDGVDDLADYLAETVPPGPWHYPEDQITDAPLRQMAAEITREKLTLQLHQELPYASTVETTAWKRLRKGGVRIEQTIYVARPSQRAIVLGHKGQTIKRIAMAARRELSDILETEVHLFVFVKVREDWTDDPERYREMGLDFPKD